MEDALIEMPMMLHFAGIDMISDRIPDETTIRAFRHLLENQDLCKYFFSSIHSLSKDQRHGHVARQDHRCRLDRGTQLQLN